MGQCLSCDFLVGGPDEVRKRGRKDLCLGLLIRGRMIKLLKKSKCRGLPLLCTTIFLLICQQNSIYITLAPLLALYDLPKRDYFTCVKQIQDFVRLGERTFDTLI